MPLPTFKHEAPDPGLMAFGRPSLPSSFGASLQATVSDPRLLPTKELGMVAERERLGGNLGPARALQTLSQTPTPFSLFGLFAQATSGFGTEPVTDPKQKELMSQEQVDAEFGHLGLKYSAPTPRAVVEYDAANKRDDFRRAEILNAAPGGLVANTLRLGAAFAVSATDPSNIATAFIPVMGPAARSALALRTGALGAAAIEGVAANTLASAAIEPATYALSRQLQLDYTMGDALLNVAFGGLLGGGLHVAGGALGRQLTRASARSRLRRFGETKLTKEQLAALPDRTGELTTAVGNRAIYNAMISPEVRAFRAIQDEINAGFAREYDPRQAIQPVPTIDASPEALEGALRGAVAQTLNGYNVHIAPIFEADALLRGFDQAARRQAAAQRQRALQPPDATDFATQRVTPELVEAYVAKWRALKARGRGRPPKNDPLAATEEELRNAGITTDMIEPEVRAQAEKVAFRQGFDALRQDQRAQALQPHEQALKGLAVPKSDWQPYADQAAKLDAEPPKEEWTEVEADELDAEATDELALLEKAMLDAREELEPVPEIEATGLPKPPAPAKPPAAPAAPKAPAAPTPPKAPQAPKMGRKIEPYSRKASDAIPPGKVGPDGEAGVFEFDASKLKVDAKRFQFKTGGDEFGVSDKLKHVKTFSRAKAGQLIVWEALDGKVYVANGHQRVGLAKRVKANDPQADTTVSAVLYREKDGISADDAMVIAAAANIAEGSGSVIDMAKIARLHPDLIGEAMRVSDDKQRMAFDLTQLSDSSFGMVVNEIVPYQYAAMVGRFLPEDDLRQNAAMDLLARAEPASLAEAESLIRQVREEAIAVEVQTGLFGDEVIASSLAVEKAKVEAAVVKLIRQDKKIFSTLMKESGRIEAAGNVLKGEVNAKLAAQAGELIEVIQKLAYRKGPISDALTQAAQEVKQGIPVKTAARGFIDNVRGSDALKRAKGGEPSPEGSLADLERARDPLGPIVGDTKEGIDAPLLLASLKEAGEADPAMAGVLKEIAAELEKGGAKTVGSAAANEIWHLSAKELGIKSPAEIAKLREKQLATKIDQAIKDYTLNGYTNISVVVTALKAQDVPHPDKLAGVVYKFLKMKADQAFGKPFALNKMSDAEMANRKLTATEIWTGTDANGKAYRVVFHKQTHGHITAGYHAFQYADLAHELDTEGGKKIGLFHTADAAFKAVFDYAEGKNVVSVPEGKEFPKHTTKPPAPNPFGFPKSFPETAEVMAASKKAGALFAKDDAKRRALWGDLFNRFPDKSNEQARQARRLAMGYTTVAFRGGHEGNDYQALGMRPRSGGVSGAVFFSDKPRIASAYAGGSDPAAAAGKGRLYPVWLRTQGFLEVDWAKRFGDQSYSGSQMDLLIREARQQGYPGIIARNISDIGGTQTQYVVLDNSAIRGWFARFDPEERFSGDYMAKLRQKMTQPVPNPVVAEIRGAMQPIIDRLPPDVRFEITEKQPESLKGTGLVSEGGYDPQNKIMLITTAALDPVNVLRHEEIHALRDFGLFTPQEWQILRKAAGRLDPETEANYRGWHKNLTEEQISSILAEEAVAHMVEAYKRGESFGGPVDRLIKRLLDFLEALRNSLAGRGYQTLDQVIARIESGEVGKRKPTPKPATQETVPFGEVATKPFDVAFSGKIPWFGDFIYQLPQNMAIASGIKEGVLGYEDLAGMVRALDQAPGTKMSAVHRADGRKLKTFGEIADYIEESGRAGDDDEIYAVLDEFRVEASAMAEVPEVRKVLEAFGYDAITHETEGLIRLKIRKGPGDEEGYAARAMQNLLATSRTAKGTLDVSASPEKAGKIEALTGEQAAATAAKNFEAAFRQVYEAAFELPETVQDMTAFVEGIAKTINKGIVKEGSLFRTDNTQFHLDAARIPEAFAQFNEEFLTRLTDARADPVETAAWVEWRVNVTDHYFADGAGKTSRALAAISLIRAGLDLPNYPPSKEFFSYAPGKGKPRKFDPTGPESYLGEDFERFREFYRSLLYPPEERELLQMVARNASPEELEAHPAFQRFTRAAAAIPKRHLEPGYNSAAWRAKAEYMVEGERVVGTEQALTHLRRVATAYAHGPIRYERRAVIIMGYPAVGKSTAAETLAPKLGAAIADVDDAKKIIPNFADGLGSSATHEESGHLGGELVAGLAHEGANLILPKVGAYEPSIRGLTDRLHAIGYRVEILHLNVPEDEAFRRMVRRFVDTGRLIDPRYMHEEVDGKPRAVYSKLKDQGYGEGFGEIDASGGFHEDFPLTGTALADVAGLRAEGGRRFLPKLRPQDERTQLPRPRQTQIGEAIPPKARPSPEESKPLFADYQTDLLERNRLQQADMNVQKATDLEEPIQRLAHCMSRRAA